MFNRSRPSNLERGRQASKSFARNTVHGRGTRQLKPHRVPTPPLRGLNMSQARVRGHCTSSNLTSLIVGDFDMGLAITT